MKKQLAYFLVCACLLLACQTRKQEKKIPVSKNTVKDSTPKKQTPPQPDTVPKIWELIKAKAKLPFSNEWKVPEQYNPALTCVKMTSQDFALLSLKGLYVENPYVPANFFHSHKIFQDFIVVAVVVEVAIYTQGIELLTYNKAGKLIDRINIAFQGGDGGMVWNSETRFLKEDAFETTRDKSYFSLPKYPNIYHKSIQNVSLTKAGKFIISPLQVIINKPQKDWLEKGEKNFERLKKGDTL